MLWQFHALWGQRRRVRKRARSRKAIGTELEWRKICSSFPSPYGNLSQRPPSKVLAMKAQGLGLQIRKEHDYAKELESLTVTSETVIL